MSKWSFGVVAIAGAVLGMLAVSGACAGEGVQKASSGRFLQAAFYPEYLIFMKGLDPSQTDTAWVKKPTMAMLDILDGPEAGKSVVVEINPSTDSSPNPQWCRTEGGENFTGRGITCLAGDPGTEQLRYRVRAQYADQLPEQFSDRDVVEYPNLPGRREKETLGAFELHVIVE